MFLWHLYFKFAYANIKKTNVFKYHFYKKHTFNQTSTSFYIIFISESFFRTFECQQCHVYLNDCLIGKE